MNKIYRVQEFAKRIGKSPSTLRRWDREGWSQARLARRRRRGPQLATESLRGLGCVGWPAARASRGAATSRLSAAASAGSACRFEAEHGGLGADLFWDGLDDELSDVDPNEGDLVAGP